MRPAIVGRFNNPEIITMAKYKVRYARIVVFEREFEADSLDDAEVQAMELENNGELSTPYCKVPSDELEKYLPDDYEDTQDYDVLWFVGSADDTDDCDYFPETD